MRGVALITASARRIGRLLSLAAAEAGYDLALHHRSTPEDALSLVAEVEAMGRRAIILPADLTAPGAPEALIAA
ncbi:MAG: short-chain dehydrogenase, partial [Alphaproteobacteria bacterium]|nr:short-chain dehydrogenase [Alphaproteobacteria bacterium]